MLSLRLINFNTLILNIVINDRDNDWISVIERLSGVTFKKKKSLTQFMVFLFDENLYF